MWFLFFVFLLFFFLSALSGLSSLGGGGMGRKAPVELGTGTPASVPPSGKIGEAAGDML